MGHAGQADGVSEVPRRNQDASECARDLEPWSIQVECKVRCVEDSETSQSTCPRMRNSSSVRYELRTRPTPTSGLFLAARGATVASYDCI